MRLLSNLYGSRSGVLTAKPGILNVIPPSHRRRGATTVLVRHKPHWHRHDRRGSAVVLSLIAVALRKTVKTADIRSGTAETLNMFKTSAVPPRVGPIRSGMIAEAPPWPPWHRTRTAVLTSLPFFRSTTAVQSRKTSRLATLYRCGYGGATAPAAPSSCSSCEDSSSAGVGLLVP